MKIKIITEASKKRERFFKKWGLSLLINDEILMDTFSEPKTLSKNIKKLKIEIEQIKYIFISHDHWDHTGGLEWVLEKNKHAVIIIGSHFSNILKNQIYSFTHPVIEVDHNFHKISDSVYSTGEIIGTYKNNNIYEQSLFFLEKEQNKMFIFTGCAHPGIFEILNKIKQKYHYQIELLMGGFHLNHKNTLELNDIVEKLKSYDIHKIAPCHCTGREAVSIIKKSYKNNFLKVKSTDIIQL